MTLHRGLFVRATGTAPSKVGTTPNESRLALAAMFAENSPGVPRSGVILNGSFGSVIGNVVYPDPTAMKYKVDPCHVVQNRATGEGVYVFTFTGVTEVTTTPAPATGSRWDIIYVKQNDTDKGDANNSPVLGVTNGTPGASPTKPSAPSGAMVLAEARIYAGTVATMEGLNTFTALYKFTALRGEPIPVRDVADRDTMAGTPGKKVMRIDRDNQIQTYSGSWTLSGWEWLDRPRRFYADTMTFDSSASAVSKLIGAVTEQGVQPYARKMRVNGRLHVSCGAIASGILSVSVNVSINATTAASAQQKSRLTFVPPGGYWMTANCETNWISVAANTDGLPRVWIEHLAGSVNHSSAATSVYAHLWVEVLPEDD